MLKQQQQQQQQQLAVMGVEAAHDGTKGLPWLQQQSGAGQ
jgi:hypothetical protein